MNKQRRVKLTISKDSIMQEEKLIKQILSGSKKAKKEFYQRYKKRLLNYIKIKAPNKQDAEEILQDTFMSAFLSLPNFKGDSSLSTWLCSIARHEIADFYRKKRIKTIVFSRLPFLENLVSKALGPELKYKEKQIKEKISKSFGSLKEEYTQILKLKYIQQKSVKEIAKILGKSFKATESLLYRARMAFQREYVN